MKSLALTILLLLPVAAVAEPPFDGTWTLDLETAQLSDKPEQIVLEDGRFQAPTSVPPIDVNADGTDRAADAPYFDTIAVSVVDDRTVRFRHKKDGKLVNEGTSTVTPDGNEIIDVFTYYPPEGAPVRGSGRRERVGGTVDGAHLISGAWRIKKVEQLGDSSLTWTFESTPGGLRMRAPTGESSARKQP